MLKRIEVLDITQNASCTGSRQNVIAGAAPQMNAGPNLAARRIIDRIPVAIGERSNATEILASAAWLKRQRSQNACPDSQSRRSDHMPPNPTLSPLCFTHLSRLQMQQDYHE